MSRLEYAIPDSHRITAWLASRFGDLPSDPTDRIAWLERKCRMMRAQGIAEHWAYALINSRSSSPRDDELVAWNWGTCAQLYLCSQTSPPK